MLRLEDLLADDEKVVRFHLHNEYFTREAIVREGNTDISGALEETLHRILEANGTE